MSARHSTAARTPRTVTVPGELVATITASATMRVQSEAKGLRLSNEGSASDDAGIAELVSAIDARARLMRAFETGEPVVANQFLHRCVRESILFARDQVGYYVGECDTANVVQEAALLDALVSWADQHGLDGTGVLAA